MKNLVPLSSLFDVTYGNKFDLNKMELAENGDASIEFIGRSGRNNGVVGKVKCFNGVEPYSSGCITVALGGAIMASFLHSQPFYTAQNVAVLRPKSEMTTGELLYYCLLIKSNAFRYVAFGREANRTLRELGVPRLCDVPAYVDDIADYSDYRNYMKPLNDNSIGIEPNKWKSFRYDYLFDIQKGKRLTKQDMKLGDTPFIGSSDTKNGLTAHIGQKPIHQGNTISVCYNGSVAEAFYQPNDYWATDDVNVLYPKFELNPFRALFLTTLIRKEKYRYNYGRKWHLGRMRESTIKLPVTKDGQPDWGYIDKFVMSLPFSSAVGQLRHA